MGRAFGPLHALVGDTESWGRLIGETGIQPD